MMNNHKTGANAAIRAEKPATILQLKPANNKTNIPELAINNDVPKSGCFKTKTTGTITINKDTDTTFILGGK